MHSKNVIKFLEIKFPGGIQIDHCDECSYIEIFGLTETEFKEVQKNVHKIL